MSVVEYHNTLNEIDNRPRFEIRLGKMSLTQFRA